jgi:N-methylhydantoinase B
MTEVRHDIDPITLEVIRNRLESVVREMGEITLRTARSAVIHTGRDFSCCILNRHGELLAVGTSIPLHVFPTVSLVQKLLERFKGDIHSGDIFVGNDPYDGGTHLNDVCIFLPLFHDGELIGLLANRAHWYDVGGMVPGSISVATEIYQEGLRIPPIRLGQGDKVNRDMLDLIFRNIRMPEEAEGDLMAQLASCRVADQRISNLIQRYGKQVVLNSFEEILDSGERRIRAIISSLPKGKIVHEGYIDNDGVDPDQRRVRVAITVEQDSIHVDCSGTAPQSRGPLNCGRSLAICLGLMGVKAALDPEGPINSGCFRPIRVTIPKGTMLDPYPPAATSGFAELGLVTIYIVAVLSKLIPQQTSAEEAASANHQSLSGKDSRFDGPKPFIYYDYPTMGGGARMSKDGLECVRNLRSGNVNAQSIEVLEKVFPVLFHCYQLRQDSGGPGKFRGGMGVLRKYSTPSDGGFSMLSDQCFVPPAGILGGYPGAPAKWEILRKGETISISPKFAGKATNFPIRAGDIICIYTPGGGGYGDPLERDPSRVREDVLDGKVSTEEARKTYGVVLDKNISEIDVEATQQQRTKLQALRILLTPQHVEGILVDSGMRVAWVNPGLVTSGFVEREIAEIYSPSHPTSLRIRVHFRADLAPKSIDLDGEVWDILGLTGQDRVLCRPLRTVTSHSCD